MNAPQEWGADDLTAFLDDAQWQSWATFVREVVWVARIRECDAIFQRLTTNMADPQNIYTAFLLLRCHSVFRAATRLALATQVPETYPLLRSCLEYGAYAVLLEDNPSKLEIWLHRNDNDATHKAARDAITWGAARRAVARRDTQGLLTTPLMQLYERCLRFGAHPNEDAVFSNMLMVPNPSGGLAFKHAYLTADRLAVQLSLESTAQVGFVVLRAFQLLLPARFALLLLDQRLDVLGESGI